MDKQLERPSHKKVKYHLYPSTLRTKSQGTKKRSFLFGGTEVSTYREDQFAFCTNQPSAEDGKVCHQLTFLCHQLCFLDIPRTSGDHHSEESGAQFGSKVK